MAWVRAWGAVVVAGAVVCGCTPKRPAAAPAPEAGALSTTREQRQRVDALAGRVAALNAVAQRLPGGADEQRALMAQYFGELEQVVAGLSPQPTGSYQQALTIIGSTQRQLAGGTKRLAMEPVIDTGLRAAFSALSSLRGRFPGPEQWDETAKSLKGLLDELDTARGPNHPAVAAQAARATAQWAGELATAYAAQVGAEAALTTMRSAPAAPAVVPATAPSGE